MPIIYYSRYVILYILEDLHELLHHIDTYLNFKSNHIALLTIITFFNIHEIKLKHINGEQKKRSLTMNAKFDNKYNKTTITNIPTEVSIKKKRVE